MTDEFSRADHIKAALLDKEDVAVIQSLIDKKIIGPELEVWQVVP